MTEFPEFMVRLKLVDDNDKEVIFKALPPGFEVSWASRPWPKDSEGFTWVRLYYDDKIALAYWRQEAQLATNKLNQIRKILG